MKAPSTQVALLTLGFLLLGFAAGSPAQRASAKPKREHPGCFIWWFLPGCYLGDRFGVDPLGIYPWKKFCARYTALESHEQCKEFQKEEEPSGSEAAEGLVKGEADEKKASHVVDKSVTKAEDDLANDIQVMLRQPKWVLAGLPDRPRRSLDPQLAREKLADFSEKYLKGGLQGLVEQIKQFKSLSAIGEYLRSGCEGNPRCASLEKMASRWLGQLRRSSADTKESLVARVVAKRSTYGGRYSVYPDHPGCDNFWFLPGCFLGNTIGVDPFNNYPWHELCNYRSLSPLPICERLSSFQLFFPEVHEAASMEAAAPTQNLDAKEGPLLISEEGTE